MAPVVPPEDAADGSRVNNPAGPAEHRRAMETADASDIRNILLVQSGRRDAFECLVHKYMRRAHGVAMQFVQNSEDALDLSQDAFLKSFRAIGRFDTKQRFFPWFYKILKNTCLTFLKRRGLVRRYSLSAPDDDGADFELVDTHCAPPDSMLVACELRDEFWRAYERLGLRNREIIALRHFQELSYQEIADALDIPIGTVMSRLFHARRKLREHLDDYL